jgi:hypothetical protein
MKERDDEEACGNCGGQRCMSCVFREMHEDCEDDCPDCCEESVVPCWFAEEVTGVGCDRPSGHRGSHRVTLTFRFKDTSPGGAA